MALSKIKGTVIADDAINADRIADGTVVASDLLDNTLTGAKLATDIAITTSGNITTTGAFTSTGIDDNATSTAITIDSSENVGIGTASPSASLHIDLNTAFANSSFINLANNGTVIGQIRMGSSSDFGLDAESGEMFFQTGNSERMRIDSSGNVGIGTSSPTAMLELFKAGTTQIKNAYSSTKYSLFGRTGGNYYWSAYEGGANLIFSTSASDNATTERMRIDSSGNVGIGNSIPGNFNAGANNLVVGSGSGDEGITIYSGSANKGNIYFADASTGTGEYTGFIDYQHSTDSLRFGTNGGITRMVIDSSGNVGIGTSSPGSLFHIESASVDPTLRITNKTLAVIDTGPDIEFWNNPFTASTENSYESGAIRVRKTNGSNNNHDHYMSFWTRQNSPEGIFERMRIDSSGNVLIAKTSPSSGTTGLELDVDGFFQSTRNGTVGLFNRITTDGTLFSFRQDGSEEGTISVSGATVSYNGFTGTHWSRFTDNSKPTILKGTVLESLDEMCDWYNLEFDVTTQDADGNDVTYTEKVPHILADGQSNGDVITYDWNTEKKDEDDNDIIEQVQATIVKEADVKHVKSKVSDTVDAKNVYGVFVAYDEDGEGYNDFYVASVGSFVVRIKANETIAKGDLLQSNGDGTAKVQSDDNIKSSSFAKVLSTTVIETYEDGSFIVPCSLMC